MLTIGDATGGALEVVDDQGRVRASLVIGLAERRTVKRIRRPSSFRLIDPNGQPSVRPPSASLKL